ncbi:MAG: Mut7-C RNAse domain-containing protein [Halodesulfurarchaeum sp.]
MPDPDDTRILLDVMCGGLTSLLRMLGYDTVYALDRDAEDDDALLAVAREEARYLLTRDRELARRHEPSLYLRATDTDEQLAALAQAGFELELTEPTRCATCNSTLDRVFDGPVPEYAPDPDAETLWRCPSCGQVFWKGSHWADVAERVADY